MYNQTRALVLLVLITAVKMLCYLKGKKKRRVLIFLSQSFGYSHFPFSKNILFWMQLPGCGSLCNEVILVCDSPGGEEPEPIAA